MGEQPEDLDVQVAAAAEWHRADDEDQIEPGEESSIRIVASGVEVLRSKSFGELSEEERAEIAALIRSLRLRVPVERTRRDPARGQGRPLRPPAHPPAIAPHPG